MATVPEPAAPGADRDRGRLANPGERGRLRTPPGPAHAPLVLGIDTAGHEHPQGPADPDDEALVGRCWGCVCGWRGTVRDVATRHFHPQVGDGGGLRRRRLARADRDTRAELEHHLAAATSPPAPAAPTAPASPTAASTTTAPRPTGEAARAHRRRRLTLPRTAPQPDDARATEDRPGCSEPHCEEPPRPPLLPVAAPPDTPPPAPRLDEDADADAGHRPPELADLDPAPEPTEQRVLDRAPEPSPAASPAAVMGGDELAAAAQRARRARAELNAAETALDTAVAAARAAGASWRTIARATGVSHRDAAARWDSAGAGPFL